MATSPNHRVPVAVELTHSQVDHVLRAAGEGGAMSLLLGGAEALRAALKNGDGPFADGMNESRYSRSLLLGLCVFATLPDDGSPMPVTAMAKINGMSPSTTHRYATTLVLAGLVEQDTKTRKYRIARDLRAPGTG